MNKKTKTLILSIVVTLILLLTFTVTYAAFVYRQTGEDNHQLVLGDIYMHYTETNSGIDIDNMMPININDYTTYEVNPVMENQEVVVVDNELEKCITLLTIEGFGDKLDPGSTVETFCRGTGTIDGGMTIQNFIESASDEEKQSLLSFNIIIEENDSYKVNPVMATQEVIDNELARCITYFSMISIDDVLDPGSTIETFCQGTGTAVVWETNVRMTIQNVIESAPVELNQMLLPLNVIIEENGSYKVNPVMATQEVPYNELTRCVELYTDREYEFDEGSTAESFCKGEGTSNGYTFQENLDNVDWSQMVVIQKIKEMLSLNIIIPQIENLEYFEFTISGKNTYKQKDIWYDVVLNHGDVPEGKLEENRINDESLRFALLEVNGENQKNIFYNRSYSSLENKRVHVEIIPKNTTEEINKTYRLYMWIDDSVVIGNVNEDYTMEEWKDVFASIKVSVTGDFNEKNYTDESCFETQVVSNYIHNSNITEDQINTCVSYISDKISLYEEENYEAYCAGTGTGHGATLENELKRGWQLTDDDVIYLLENNIILKSNDSIAITDYDESCGSDVIIPNKINGYEVTEIADSAFNDKNIKSVILPNTMKVIRGKAFTDNQILSVKIPSSVSYLSCYAFYMFQETVTIEKEENLVCVGDVMI